VLWEDRPGPRESSRWAPLLPLLTGRAFLGGLGPDVCIEHAYPTLVGETLARRPIGEWTDGELDQFCQRYNVGWVVCWSPAAVARFRAWPGATPRAVVTDQGEGCLFALRPRSFLLRGRAESVRADCRQITLTNVTPEKGRVVLSWHYQPGMQVSPARVEIEREPDPNDPIPFIRLRVPGGDVPVAQVTVTWEPGKSR
jgi:hypothetical protein